MLRELQRLRASIETEGYIHVHATKFKDPTVVGETNEVFKQDVINLGSQDFSSKRVVMILDDAYLVYQWTNSNVRTETEIPTDLVAFQVVGAESKGTVGGIEMGPDTILLGGPGGADEFVVEPPYESVTFLVSLERLNKELVQRQREDEIEVSQSVELLQGNSELVRSVFAYGKDISEAAGQERILFNSSARARASAAEDLLELILSALQTATPRTLDRKGRTRHAYSEILKACESYALEQGPDKLYVGELCDVAGASERTLQYAFQELLGMTPLSYIRRLRLHRIRRELLDPESICKTVSQAAFEWGSWNLGEFSREYSLCFGELPSETLKRRPKYDL